MQKIPDMTLRVGLVMEGRVAQGIVVGVLRHPLKIYGRKDKRYNPNELREFRVFSIANS